MEFCQRGDGFVNVAGGRRAIRPDSRCQGCFSLRSHLAPPVAPTPSFRRASSSIVLSVFVGLRFLSVYSLYLKMHLICIPPSSAFCCCRLHTKIAQKSLFESNLPSILLCSIRDLLYVFWEVPARDCQRCSLKSTHHMQNYQRLMRSGQAASGVF